MHSIAPFVNPLPPLPLETLRSYESPPEIESLRLPGCMNEVERRISELRDIVREHDELQKALTSYRSYTSTLRRFPTEIFAKIFTFCCELTPEETLAPRDTSTTALRISHVCSYWRNVARQMPQLWTDIAANIQNDPECYSTANWRARAELLNLYLFRSNDKPLSVSLSFPLESDIDMTREIPDLHLCHKEPRNRFQSLWDIAKVTLKAKDRWQHLYLGMSPYNVNTLLRSSYPQLESTVIDCSIMEEDPEMMPAWHPGPDYLHFPFDDERSPRLHKVILRGWPTPAPKSKRKLPPLPLLAFLQIDGHDQDSVIGNLQRAAVGCTVVATNIVPNGTFPDSFDDEYYFREQFRNCVAKDVCLEFSSVDTDDGRVADVFSYLTPTKVEHLRIAAPDPEFSHLFPSRSLERAFARIETVSVLQSLTLSYLDIPSDILICLLGHIPLLRSLSVRESLCSNLITLDDDVFEGLTLDHTTQLVPDLEHLELYIESEVETTELLEQMLASRSHALRSATIRFLDTDALERPFTPFIQRLNQVAEEGYFMLAFCLTETLGE